MRISNLFGYFACNAKDDSESRESICMQQTKNESFGQHYFSAHLRRKMKMLAVSTAAIIEAPSGYGKTTAIRGYIKEAASDDEDVFWFTAVDEEAPTMLYRRF